MDRDFIFTFVLEKQNDKLIELYRKHENIQIIADGENNKIMGKYVIFAQDIISDELLNDIYDFTDKFGEIELIHIDDVHEGIVDLNKDFRHSFLDIGNTFIRTDMINDLSSVDFIFLNKILIDIGKYGTVCSNMKFTSNGFKDKIDDYEELFKYSQSDFVQYAFLNDLNQIIIDNDLTAKNYRAKLFGFLQNVDDDLIKNHNGFSNRSRRFVFYLKNDDFHHLIKANRLQLKAGNYVINGLHGHVLTLDIVNIRNGCLNISGFFKSSCDPEFLNFQAVLIKHDGSEEIFNATKNEYPTTGRHRRSYLGIDWEFYPCFDVEIPINNKSNFKVIFKIKFSEDGDEIYLNPRIVLDDNCNISKLSNYFIKDSKIVLFKDNAIYLTDYSFMFKTNLELKSIVNIIKSGENNSLYSIYIRIIYAFMSLFWRNKRIWLFADRPLVADDNAKHLFSYAVSQKDEVVKYYLLDEKSDDIKKMKQISKNIVKIGSLKHKILYLFAEKFISSHSDPNLTNPFFESNHQLYSGLTTMEKVFLQHGITIHDVSYWLRKFYHDFLLFVTASDMEKDSIIHPNYNYDDRVVKTLGFPRYDNLSNDVLKKQILFMPTWRKSISNEEDLLNSQYFKMINNLFNNDELLELLNKNGFKIIFKPHFELLKYCELFDIPDEVILSKNESYQELFNKSMLMITDYSSVFFDFAYLKKPVIYFRPDDEFHYDSGYFDFDTMGFGEITTSIDELVMLIRKYLNNDCTMDEEYLKRVNKFFKYQDKNNCRRVYDWLYENK